jgi:hypothetical protein
MAKRKSIRVSAEEADEIMNEAYDNSYRLLVGKISYRGLERECNKRDSDMYLTYYNDEGATLQDAEDILEWYKEKEWYERCAVLKRYIDKRFKKGK